MAVSIDAATARMAFFGLQERCKTPAAVDVAALRMRPQFASGHVDHALTQLTDGGISPHRELLLSEVAETSIFPQDGASHPAYRLLSTVYPALDRAPRAAAIAAAI